MTRILLAFRVRAFYRAAFATHRMVSPFAYARLSRRH